MSKQRDFYHVSLKAILKNAEGKILILKANNTGPFYGFYDLPGGRIDEDEFLSPLANILKREIEEETGIDDVSINDAPVAVGRSCIEKKYSTSKKDIHVLNVFYESHLNSGDVKISEEHEGFEWVDLSNIELEKYFIPGVVEVLKMYLKK